MNVGSLFSGAGLLDYGLTCAGFQHAWFCESDPYCRSILERRWPGVPVFDDVKTLTGADPVDVLAGGFPCQPFSGVGEQRGLADERWLWPDFARVVGELRPRYVLVENVPGFLAGHGGMGNVLGDLAELGYDAEWDCLRAADVGAPHIRKRVFVLAYARGARRREDTGSASGDEGADAGWAASHDHVVDGDGQGGGAGDVADADCEPLVWASVARPQRDPWPPEPDVGRMAYGVPHRVDRLRALGNGVVPPIAEWIGRRILEAEAVRVAA